MQNSSTFTTKAKRQQFVYQIKKQKIEKFLILKRFKANNRTLNDYNNKEIKVLAENDLLEIINSIEKLIQVEAISLLLEEITKIRILISYNKDESLIDKIVNCGTIPSLLKILNKSFSKNTNLQYEALWIITNILCGSSHTINVLFSKELYDTLISFLYHDNDDHVTTALWCLANLAGDTNEIKMLLIEYGIFEELNKLLKIRPSYSITFMKHLTWAVSNLISMKPPIEKFYMILPAMEYLINLKDSEIILNVLYFYSYFTCDQDESLIINKINRQFIKLFLTFFDNPDYKFSSLAIKCVGNLLSYGENTLTKSLIKNGLIQKLNCAINHSDPHVKKEVCWCLLNLLEYNQNAIQIVIEESIFQKIFEILKTSNFDIINEALPCINHIIISGKFDHIQRLISMGLLDILSFLLGQYCPQIILSVLECLKELLHQSEVFKKQKNEKNDLFGILEDHNLINAIERLQSHELPEIYRKVTDLIDNFFISDII